MEKLKYSLVSQCPAGSMIIYQELSGYDIGSFDLDKLNQHSVNLHTINDKINL